MKELTKQVVALLIIIPLAGQFTFAKDSTSKSWKESTSNFAIMANHAQGLDVKTSDGRDLGEVADVIVDLDSGEVKYYLISTGFLGFGPTKKVPADAISISKDGYRNFVINESRDSLDEYAAYDDSKTLEENLSEEYTRAKRDYSNRDQVDRNRTDETKAESRVVKAMDISDKDVYSSDGDRVGEFYDWVINPGNQKVSYVIFRDLRRVGPVTAPYDYTMVETSAVKGVADDIKLSVSSDEIADAPSVSESDMIEILEKGLYDNIVFKFKSEST